MSKRMLLSIVVVLIILNIATLILWKREGRTVIEESGQRLKPTEDVATVGKETISYQDWMQSLRSSYGKEHLKTMIDRLVVSQLANEQQITIDEKIIDRDIAILTTMHGVLTMEEKVALTEQWREDIIYRYQLEALLTEGIEIAEDDMRDYYDKYRKQYNFSESVQLSHIIVENQTTAEKIVNELREGASFPLLAQEYSIDEETIDAGGYLGHFKEESQFLPSDYFEKAITMEEESFSEPFQTDQGVVILWLHSHLPEYQFTYEEIKPYIERELALNTLEQSLEAKSLWDKLDIEWVYED